MTAKEIQQRKRTMRLRMLLVIAAAAIVYFIGARSVSLWDRDEAWYAQTSRQMMESGDWVVPRFLDSPRYAKPVFIYWCQAASMKILGPSELAARLPSALAMLGTISILAVVLGRTVGKTRTFYTILIFASSAIVIAAGKMCLTDSVMLFFLTAAQLALFRIYSHAKWSADEDPRTCFIFWFAVAGAMFTKGPFPAVVLLATMIVLAALDVGRGWKKLSAWKGAIAWWRRTRPLIGIVIIICVTVPWLIMLYLRERGALRQMLAEPLRHLTSDQDSHWLYPGYYLVTIWLTYFPWSLLLPAALIYAWRRRENARARFALSTILGNWIFVEMMITKLPHYMLPSYSSLAFITSGIVIVWMRKGLPRAVKIGAVFWACAAIALALLPWVAYKRSPFALYGAVAFTTCGIIYALAVTISWMCGRPRAATAIMGFGMMGMIAILFALYFPDAVFLKVPELVGTKLRSIGATGKDQVVMIGYVEPSLAFYQGGTIRPRADDFLLRNPPENWPNWIVLREEHFQALPPEKRDRLEQIASYHGFNYNIPVGPVTVLIARTKK